MKAQEIESKFSIEWFGEDIPFAHTKALPKFEQLYVLLQRLSINIPDAISMHRYLRSPPYTWTPRMLKIMMAIPNSIMESNTKGNDANRVLMTIFRDENLVMVRRGRRTLKVLKELAEKPT